MSPPSLVSHQVHEGHFKMTAANTLMTETASWQIDSGCLIIV
jgi:hypothetical protein